MNKVKIEIEYNANGLPILERLGNPYLSFRLGNPNELYIEGNQDGLLLLAKALLGMAEYVLSFCHLSISFIHFSAVTNKTIAGIPSK